MNLICFIADVLIKAPLSIVYFDNRHPAGVFPNPAPANSLFRVAQLVLLSCPTRFAELPNSFC